MMRASRKRAYVDVAVLEEPEGFALALDGKPLLTATKRPLRLPSRALAVAIAGEWTTQGQELDPRSMALTRLAHAAIDIVAPGRAEIARRTAEFAGTDLLCYRASEPEELAQRQQKLWQPLLDWAAARYGASLIVAQGVMAAAQPADALGALGDAVAALDDMRLAALAAATPALGSLVLALALLEGRLDAEAAFALSQLDESYQSERWGENEEAAAHRARLKEDIAAVAHFFALLRE
jgi:chaperone required for assembly of F1-ATPase